MIWKKYILTRFFILTGFVGAFATPRGPSDELVYNGDTIFAYLSLLPDEFYRNDTVNINHSEYVNRILTVKLFRDKNACWSGIRVTWIIEDNQLYLTGIYSSCYYEDSIKTDLTSLFREKVINGKVKADWVNSKVIAQNWKDYIFQCYDIFVFKKQLEFEFLGGKLLNVNFFDNSKSRRSTFSQDEKKRIDFIYTSIKWDNLPKQQEPIRVNTRFSANEDGIIDDVEIIGKNDNEIFNQEAIRVIKSIPDWDVIYLKGQLYRQYFSMPIVFSEENQKKYGK